jgi:hypothetical protein
MSTKHLRDMSPRWLNSSVKHISQPIPGEERNIIEKGCHQMYLESIVQGTLTTSSHCGNGLNKVWIRCVDVVGAGGVGGDTLWEDLTWEVLICINLICINV